MPNALLKKIMPFAKQFNKSCSFSLTCHCLRLTNGSPHEAPCDLRAFALVPRRRREHEPTTAAIVLELNPQMLVANHSYGGPALRFDKFDRRVDMLSESARVFHWLPSLVFGHAPAPFTEKCSPKCQYIHLALSRTAAHQDSLRC
jgi:hypothetical protein